MEDQLLSRNEQLGELVSTLMEVDELYRQSEEVIAQEETKNRTLVGILKDQIVHTETKPHTR